MNYFFLCDSPTLETGFSRVSTNVLTRLNVPNKKVWALGYNGEPHDYDMQLFPANVNSSWEHPYNIQRFAEWILSYHGPKTLWTLYDPHRLKKFTPILEQLKADDCKIISYVPVDSPLQPDDLKFLQIPDLLVAYSAYGHSEIKKIAPDAPTIIIPHGYDPAFQPFPDDIDAKAGLFQGQLEDRCLIGCVNSNTERKALHRSIEILAELNEMSDNLYVMYMHCHSTKGHYDLPRIAYQLEQMENIIFADNFFHDDQAIIGRSSCDKGHLMALYNAFDIFLSTTYGEGWGLTISEAACCGTPICIPRNTVLPEIYREESAIWLPIHSTAHYSGKIVPDIHPKVAAQNIHQFVTEEFFLDDLRVNAKQDVEKFSWDDIGSVWNEIFSEL